MTGLLPDHLIVAAVEAGAIGIEPWDPAKVQPCSVDLTLDSDFMGNMKKGGWTDPARDHTADMVPMTCSPDSGFLLLSHMFVLAGTREEIYCDASHACRVEGKSSLGRLGLAIHVTAGWIDPGFRGQVTLELVNHSGRPIRLWPGMKIAQACFWELAAPAHHPYGSDGLASRYQGQEAPTASRSWTTFTSDSHPAA